MTSEVFFGSARQCRLEAKETLPAKLDLILEGLHLRERVKDETVAIKMLTPVLSRGHLLTQTRADVGSRFPSVIHGPL